MSGKYAPLRDHLRRAAEADAEVAMTFDAIGRLIGGLPPSAYRYREWWANNSHSQASSWTEAGFRVAHVDLRSQRATFQRAGSTSEARHARPTSTAPQDRDMPALDDVTVVVRFTWRALGVVELDAAGKLRFPDPPAAPGLYRMSLTGGRLEGRPRVYVGESQDLRHRLAGNYRNPGPSQQTSKRVNALLTQHVTEGGRADVAVALTVEGRLGQNGLTVPLDLTRKADRLLAENAALITLRASGGAEIENLG